MLFLVEMTVRLPHDLDKKVIEDLKAREKAMAQELQKSGKWRHLWRVVGKYSNISIFNVQSSSELHNILTELPLFPYLEINVQPLCRHPSSIHESDQ